MPSWALFFFAASSILSLATADEFAFFDACRDGDLDGIALGLASDTVDVNYPDEDGFTPLILSTKSGNLAAMKKILDGGANIELAADYPAPVDTPLCAAAQQGELGAMELLLMRGAAVDGPGRDGRTPLMSAGSKGRLDMVEYLLGKGADVNATKADGTTALFWASHAAHPDVVVRLLAEGAHVDARDFVDGSQAIHLACQGSTSNGGEGERAQGATRAVLNHLLTFGADPMARSGVTGPRNPDGSFKEDPKREELEGGKTPLHVASAEGNLDALQLLLSMRSLEEESIDKDSSRSRVKEGEDATTVDVNGADVQGLTAVSLAAMQGQEAALTLLLDAGAKPDRPAADARAPLHHAAFSGHAKCCKLLLSHGARVDQPSALTNGAGPGQTALLLASAQGHLKVVKTLIKAGANANAPAKDGATPLIAGASGGHKKVVKYLLASGADPRRRLESGETAAVVTRDRDVATLLYMKEYELNAKDKEDEAEAAAGSSGAPGHVDDDIVLDEEDGAFDEVNLDVEEDEEDEEADEGDGDMVHTYGAEL